MLGKLLRYYKIGFLWGFTMFLTMSFLLPYLYGNPVILKNVIGHFVGFMIFGAPIFGYVSSRKLFKQN